MRRYILGSLAAHLLFLVLASAVASVFVRRVPSLKVMRLDLQALELPAPTPVPREEVVIPEAPAELPAKRPPVDVEATPESSDEPSQADLRAPEPLLPREPVPLGEWEEPASENSAEIVRDDATEESEPAEAEVRVENGAEEISAEPTTTVDGGAVQASSTEGVSDFYLARVQQKIGRRWRPSPAATAGRDRAECLVHFRIGPGGEVIGPSIARSSGLSVFDRQALRAVLESSPMPAVPPRFERTGLEIRFLFSYER